MGDASSSLQGAMCGLADAPTLETPELHAGASTSPTAVPRRPGGPAEPPSATRRRHGGETSRGQWLTRLDAAPDLSSRPTGGCMPGAIKSSASDASTAASDNESCASSSSSASSSRCPSGSVVRLHVYDLGKNSAKMNRYAKDAGLGAFHTGVEVYGREYCFGKHEGVCYVKPTMDPCHEYRETIEMGATKLTPHQIASKISRLRLEWTGDSYRLLTRNCHHFSEAFLKELGVAELPAWCNSLAGKPVGFASWFSSDDTDFDGGSAIWEAFGGPSEESKRHGVKSAAR